MPHASCRGTAEAVRCRAGPCCARPAWCCRSPPATGRAESHHGTASTGKNSPPYLELLYLKGNQLLQQPGPGWACPPLAACGGRADTRVVGEEGKARGGSMDEVLMGQHRGNVELSPQTARRGGTSPWQHFYSKSKAREERLL